MVSLRKKTPPNARRKARPEIYLTMEEGGAFEVTSRPDSSCFTLENLKFYLIRPYAPITVSTGISFVRTGGYATIVYGICRKKTIVCHVGLIDPNYMGVISVVLFNTSERNNVLLPGELTVKICAINFFSPTLTTPSHLCEPQYFGDAGYDVRSPTQQILFPFNEVEIPLMVRNPLKNKYYIPIIMGRSGLAKQGLYVKVTVWDGSVAKLCIRNLSAATKLIHRGDRLCQMVFIRRDQIKNSLYFLCHDRVGKIFLKGADVSFVNADEDIYKSLVTLPPRIQHSEGGPERSNSVRLPPQCQLQAKISAYPRYHSQPPLRGKQGFGSSGI